MSTERQTLLERARPSVPDESLSGPETDVDGSSDDRPPERVASTGMGAKSTTIGGDRVDLGEPRTDITFEDSAGILSGAHGRPRPADFYHARQLGQTPQVQLIKNVVVNQLTGGDVKTEAIDGDELRGDMADFAEIVRDIYRGPHFQEKSFDNLITDTVNDLIDSAWAYHEKLPSDGGEFPVAGFKPLPPLQVFHNLDEDTGEFVESPAFYHAPLKSTQGHVEVTSTEPTELDREDVVVMRDPISSRSNMAYGESRVMSIREWLELITDVDVHQKRHYADSHLPAGFIHFLGSIGDDDLAEVERDIQEVAGDPHELVTTTSDDDAKWIPVGGEVADMEAIQQQQWYWKLVLAAFGLTQNEINMVESSGFAKESPEMQKMLFKNVTKPFMSAIFDAHNTQAVDDIAESVGVGRVPFRVGLERFDPVQEQIERDQRRDAWKDRYVSLNEMRAAEGLEAREIPVELEDIDDDGDGGTVNLADQPRWVVELFLDDSPDIDLGELAEQGGS